MIWQCGSYRFDLDKRPLIMGILNVTPDSFSDGYPRTEQAIAHAKQLVADGADIIDVGGESTRPGSDPVTEEVELQRIIPVIERMAQTCNVAISVDTQKPEVARRAVEAGASIINHVSGTLDYESMLPVLDSCSAGYVAMHMRDRPKTMQKNPSYNDVMDELIKALQGVEQALAGAGIDCDRLLFDPGIGFGKKLNHNMEILHGLKPLKRHLGRPLLMGISRKSWFDHLLRTQRGETSELDAYTVLASTLMPFPEVAVHRVHNVKWLKRGLTLKDSMEGQSLS
jgi:dihydropteroate synthase